MQTCSFLMYFMFELYNYSLDSGDEGFSFSLLFMLGKSMLTYLNLHEYSHAHTHTQTHILMYTSLLILILSPPLNYNIVHSGAFWSLASLLSFYLDINNCRNYQ